MATVDGQTVGSLVVRVHPDPGALARAAADEAAGIIRRAVDARGVANVMFATGNSQLAFIDCLTQETPDVPWADVVVLHMDEYVGIGTDHPASFACWIRHRITDRVHPRVAYYVDGLADPVVESARYTVLLADNPLDLCCLGIGENGHLAFNDPGVADFTDPLDVKPVELDEPCRRQQVGEGHFPDIAAVPALAVTVTVPALLRAARVLAVVPDARKAVPVRAALEGPITPDCPASALRTKAGAVLHLEPHSASLLAPT